ncbi:ATP synthase subunit delta [Geodia barretti]|uniref:ATP synthase peripheral stalk subunit OSCP, mitochondrial n=1 Tax=Geodia barretti TaxID=519541 RepID=A0AA35SAH1_GEOBA|nr:ATP synthase subunit delta [Geodia barretti]
MNAPEVVRRYAVTLLEAADETGATAAVQRDVERLLQTVRQSGELVEFLSNPLADSQAQANVLRQLFSGKVAEREGIIGAEVRSAVALSEEQCQRLQARLEHHSGRKVRLEVQVDTSLRGGAVVRVGDTVFDGSVNTYLERLQARLAG